MSYKKVKTPNNIDLCYEMIGEKSSNIPIVLISGAGLQMLEWPTEFCLKLAEKSIPVIRFDNRDCGESSILDNLPAPSPLFFSLKHKFGISVKSPYSLGDMANDIIDLLDALNIKKAHLVGISLGGMIAQIATINSGERVASLTVIAAPARNSRRSMPKLKTVLKIMRSHKPGRQGYIDWSLDLIKVVGGTAALDPDDKYLREMSGQMYDRGISDNGLKRQVCAVYASDDRRPFLSKLRTSTLVIHGSEDPLISPEATQEVADYVPNAKFIQINNMGHGILRPVWSKLVEIILNHVKESEIKDGFRE